MKSYKLFICFISVLFLVIFSIGLDARNSTSDTGFVPEVGQKGKDVIWVPTPAKKGARALGIEYNPDMVALSK